MKRVLSIIALSTLVAGPAVGGEVRAPHWGDVLFNFYQGKDFQAVTTLMASQQFDRLPPHADEGEALRGGLLLSYGLHRDAEVIFTRLAEQGTTPAMRDRAWYTLAKIRWQRGLGADAASALAKVAAPLPGGLQEERQLLDAQLRIAAADYAGAANVLGALAADTKGTPYARFNLGVALVRTGDLARGGQWLAGLGKMPAADEEQRSLRDKANLALGFGALQDDQPALAREHLQRVRLHGPYANKALLGFGWAAAKLEQPGLALVPWQELSTRDASDPAVLEARLAVPYAYAELKAYGQAHEGYRQAIAAYDREIDALDQTIVAVRVGKLVDALLDRNPGADLGWLWKAETVPDIPHPSQLAPLLASHAFQEALKDQRDLRFLLANLQRWADDLGSFGDMLDNRRTGYAERLPVVRAEARKVHLGALRQRRGELSEALAAAERQADGRALADASERALIERLARAQAMLASLPPDERSATARQRAERIAGALTWQLARQHPARIWEAKKSLRSIDESLAEAERRDAALAQAQRDEPARFDRLAGRIAALAKQLQVQIPRVAALRGEQQLALQEMAVTALLTQKSRLVEYGAQARFAVAQLQDRATVARVKTDATPR